jgi:very-short-patch-repair endonuclease
MVIQRHYELAFDRAIVNRVVRSSEIKELLGRAGGHKGRARLATLAAAENGTTITRSQAEERVLALIRSAQLPDPAVNRRVHGYEVDFYWADEQFVLEVDGFRFHSTRRAFEHDRRKDTDLRAAGLETMRVTWRQVEHEPFALVARMARAIARSTAGS